MGHFHGGREGEGRGIHGPGNTSQGDIHCGRRIREGRERREWTGYGGDIRGMRTRPLSSCLHRGGGGVRHRSFQGSHATHGAMRVIQEEGRGIGFLESW